MTQSYWLDRWERNEIGFHQDAYNPYLIKHWPRLHLAPDSSVFVPLCGKTRDMIWLRDQGHAVLGVELSARAIQAFYRENALAPKQAQYSGKRFNRYSAENIEILHGDFFDLDKNGLASIQAVYDRASLVALPPDPRRRYAAHMLDILPPATQILLVGFDYPQAEMQGPPYAVPPEEVIALYQPGADVRLLTQVDMLADNPRFQQRGLTRLVESVYLLTLPDPEQS
ncbi:thiopurine S-methyltransferase [Nitrosomonas sp. Nm51]|uniref:thiopurine S-methyltransferase n=1 Tax=Nitrosomonas sp. Nm51 TaxID=133720 RepID=UPI0008AC0D69|nr:thiopurine S-methyltransferase [Nitrosomonas sp. Nm51]SER22837.1 thiopurine S-methyltransferase [Nitrosomonas sp. Nm51]